jgi:hypothetical protein
VACSNDPMEVVDEEISQAGGRAESERDAADVQCRRSVFWMVPVRRCTENRPDAPAN